MSYLIVTTKMYGGMYMDIYYYIDDRSQVSERFCSFLLLCILSGLLSGLKLHVNEQINYICSSLLFLGTASGALTLIYDTRDKAGWFSYLVIER